MIKIGGVIRTLRMQKHMALRELAAKVDLSASYLSQIENDQANMSLSVVERISEALETPIQTFFMQDKLSNVSFVRRTDREKMARSDSATMERLTNSKVTKFDTTIVTYPARYRAQVHATHAGEEFMLVIDGMMTVDLDGVASYALESGDCLVFPSTIPHRVSSEDGCRVLIQSSTLPVAFI